MGMPPDLNIVVFVKQEHFEAFHMKKLPLLYNIAAGTGDIYEVYVSSPPDHQTVENIRTSCSLRTHHPL